MGAVTLALGATSADGSALGSAVAASTGGDVGARSGAEESRGTGTSLDAVASEDALVGTAVEEPTVM